MRKGCSLGGGGTARAWDEDEYINSELDRWMNVSGELSRRVVLIEGAERRRAGFYIRKSSWRGEG